MRRAYALPWLLATAIAAVYLVVQPVTADLAAQVFRSDLFERQPFGIWNGNWFAGHHTPGYSALYPPLGALLGPALAGALAAVAAAVLFERIATAEFGERARVGALLFAVATATNLFTGRLTFALGVAGALGAIMAAQRGRRLLTVLLAALCPLASPVASLFLALAATSYLAAQALGRDSGGRWRLRLTPSVRRALELAGVTLAVAVVLALAFPESGQQPFLFSAYWPTVALAVGVVALVPPEQRTLRIGAVLYALSCTVAFVVDTPMGGNAVRLGTMFAAPLLACVLWRRRTLALALVPPPLIYWQWKSPVADLAQAARDPAVKAGYYAPLNRFLAAHGGSLTRVEVPATLNHWDSHHVGARFPLARGWERQADRKYNAVLYSSALDAGSYRRWLDELGVRYVALPDAKLDYGARREAGLIRGGLPYLRPVWHDRHWQVYEVESASPLVSGPAHLHSMGPDSFTLRAQAPGQALVRVRFTRYWKLTAGSGCIEAGPDGLTRVRLDRAGELRAQTSFSLRRLLERGPRCRR